ncbi:MAG TPA: gluconate 2-dehydrogenase subunit 3 family protein [Chthoniobacteraceae bacterium]|jgi:hypothetical protein|nr:gluconate 2-dehydrogenase subunit 3 family protein [Chthoniobacteraceae bacterium]
MNPDSGNHSPAREDHRPVDPATGEPLPAREQPGYYPGFRTLDQQSHWDAATRKKIIERVHTIPPIRFFTAPEAEMMTVIAEHILPQDDRLPARRIPIVPRIDERLHTGRIAGYRFAKMPPDGDAYRLGFQAIEQMSRHAHGKSFIAIAWRQQAELLLSIHDAKPMPGAEDAWARMQVHRYWAMLVHDCAAVYYAHPWAWDEIGFGGPAYPRAYFRLENGEPEPWEVEESRYEWEAPPGALSDPAGGGTAAHSEQPPLGQGGTH